MAGFERLGFGLVARDVTPDEPPMACSIAYVDVSDSDDPDHVDYSTFWSDAAVAGVGGVDPSIIDDPEAVPRFLGRYELVDERDLPPFEAEFAVLVLTPMGDTADADGSVPVAIEVGSSPWLAEDAAAGAMYALKWILESLHTARDTGDDHE